MAEETNETKETKPSDAETRETKNKPNALIAEALKAYGIDAKFMLGSAIDAETGEAVIVTSGGAKVRYAKGAKVDTLDPVMVDGIIRKKMKPITGAKKKGE